MGWGSTLGMALGAGAGAATMVPGGTAVGAGLGGAVGGMFDDSGASDAAKAMQDQANQWRGYVSGQQDKALALVNTPAQMAAYDQALQGQEQNVRRQETLAASIDPNLIEAGKQTAQLLQGHSAPVLANMQNQRNLQRTQVLDNLRQQLGPGAETSSAGIQAMQKFDNDTANMMSQAQQQYLDKVSTMSIGGAQTLGQSLSQVNSTLSGMQTQSPGAQAADLMAKFTQAMAGPEQAQMETAGGQFIGKQLDSQRMFGLSQSLIQGGAAMYGAKGGGTASTPSGTTNPNSGNTADQYNPNSQNWQDYAANNRAQTAPGTLAGSVAAPGMAGGTRAASSPSAPSYLPFSSGYGGSGTAANYSTNPSAVPYQPFKFNPNYSYGSSNMAGGN